MSLEAITAAAVQSAVDAGTMPPAPDGTATSVDIAEPESTESAVVESADAGDTTTSVADPPADGTERKWPESFDGDTVKLLEELGYNPPTKDNRMPYSKALRQIAEGVKKARAKDAEASTKQSAEWKTKEERLSAFERMQQLANSDAEGFIRSLASQRPDLYARFLEAKREAATTSDKTETQTQRAADPEPEPDVKYDDGSVGYSAAQFKSHNEWLIREGKRQATEAMEARIKPIEEREKRAVQRAQLAQSTHAQEAKAEKRWGKLFTDNKDVILAAMVKDDELAKIERRRLTPFEDIVHEVLMPMKETALTADRNKVREELLKELNERKDAAKPKRAAVQAKDDDGDDNASLATEDIVRNAVRKAGLIR
jgi:hypothetical protein